ncbi:MAG: hypothetical protein JST84_25760 [Acidobacteria bacterium]|nr:hypothetical protein [Acidobacteriota bacterium]
MRQVKAYVELQSYNETTSFVEAERVVSSYIVTKEMGGLIARLLSDLAAPRGKNVGDQLPALHIITGQRGVGKSHLLAFVRSLISVKALRSMIAESSILNALGLIADKTISSIEVNFVGCEHEPFESRLRRALCETLKLATYHDDEKWAAAVKGEQVFEQAFGALPLGAQVILFIDGLPGRWRNAPEQVEADLDWLALIARQADALPLRAVIVRDEEADPLEPAGSAIYNIPTSNLREIIARRILKKTPQQLLELEELYDELMQMLPGLAWSKKDFAEAYPLHPVLFENAPAFRATARSFSLPSFIVASVPRVLSRPATSLITPDEVFDRYEYEFRKNEELAQTLKLYDQIITEAIAKLPVMEKLWAKLILKTLFIFSIGGQAANAYQVAQAQMLMEEGNPTAGYERVARILNHFATCCPEAFTLKGSGQQCSYLLASVNQTINSNLERQIASAAREISPEDVRLGDLLLTQGLGIFQDFPDDGADKSELQAFPQPPPQTLIWRGSKRVIDICLPGQEVSESPWRLLIAPLAKRVSDDPVSTEKPADEIQKMLMDIPADDFTLTWEPGQPANPSVLGPLKRLLALQQIIETRIANGMTLTEDFGVLREKLRLEVRALFGELYLMQGVLKDATRNVSVASFAEKMEPGKTFQSFFAQAFDWFFSKNFPQHPAFSEALSLEQADALLTQFFTGTEAQRQTQAMQQAAEQWAVPLGIACKMPSPEFSADLYQPDIFSESTQQRPFVQAVLSFIDHHADETGVANVPLILVERLLSDSPYGLQRATQYLLFGALTATNLLELIDETHGHTLNKENLIAGFDLSVFTAVRRVASVSYPATVLGEWARLLTKQPSLPIPNSPENDKKIREAMRHWLDIWEQEQLQSRFEQLPFDMLTLSAWRALNTSKTRFSRVSALVEAAVGGKIEVKTVLSRIADIFGLDRASLTQMQNEMLELCGFLDWMPIFSQLRNYLLVVEPTSDPLIQELRTQLTEQVQDSRTLLNVELRQKLEEKFLEFRKRYSEFYAAAHEAEVGPSANRQLIATFCASPEWLRFRLLMELKLEGGAFERDAQALLKLAQETRCDLPVFELLQHQPHCCCTFRLHRQVHLGNLLEALKSIISAASTYYSLAIWRHRGELREKVKEIPDPTFQNELEDFLTACGNGDLSDINADLVSFINDCVAKQTSSANVA